MKQYQIANIILKFNSLPFIDSSERMSLFECREMKVDEKLQEVYYNMEYYDIDIFKDAVKLYDNEDYGIYQIDQVRYFFFMGRNRNRIWM